MVRLRVDLAGGPYGMLWRLGEAATGTGRRWIVSGAEPLRPVAGSSIGGGRKSTELSTARRDRRVGRLVDRREAVAWYADWFCGWTLGICWWDGWAVELRRRPVIAACGLGYVDGWTSEGRRSCGCGGVCVKSTEEWDWKLPRV